MITKVYFSSLYTFALKLVKVWWSYIMCFKHVIIYKDFQRDAIESESLAQPAVTFGILT